MKNDLKTTRGRRAEGLPLPQIEGIEHRFVEMQDIRLHLAEAGQGEPLLLLHGWPQHWYMWCHLIPQLAVHYRVLCPDLRTGVAGWAFSCLYVTPNACSAFSPSISRIPGSGSIGLYSVRSGASGING